jgi:hypothetical protein
LPARERERRLELIKHRIERDLGGRLIATLVEFVPNAIERDVVAEQATKLRQPLRLYLGYKCAMSTGGMVLAGCVAPARIRPITTWLVLLLAKIFSSARAAACVWLTPLDALAGVVVCSRTKLASPIRFGQLKFTFEPVDWIRLEPSRDVVLGKILGP